MLHKMKLDNGPFTSIKTGKKDIEMRLYDEKRQAIHPGDEIEFTNNSNGEVVTASVVALHLYKRFDDLYALFDKERLGYSANEAANADDMLIYYSSEDIERFGVVGIEIKIKS